jgi:sugar lactone lactonase YvrE
MSGASLALSRLPRWAVIKDARRRQRRRHRRNGLAVVAALAVAASGLWVTERSTASGPNSPSRPGSAVGSVNVGGVVLDSASEGHRIWVLTCVRDCSSVGKDSDQLVEVDASTRAVVHRFSLSNAVAIAPGDGAVWVAHFLTGEVTRINPRTGRSTAAITLHLPVPIVTHVGTTVRRYRGFLPDGISYADGYVRVSTARGWVAQINARTGKLVSMVASPSEATSTTTDSHGTWVAEDLAGVGFLAPHRHLLAIRPIEWAGEPLTISSVVRGAGLIWAVGQVDALTGPSTTVVATINPRTRRVIHRQRVPGTGSAVFTAGALYLGDLKHGRVYRLSGAGVMQTLATPRRNATLATATPGLLWATTTTAPERLVRVSPAGLVHRPRARPNP